MCAAPIGNQFWKARTKHGRDKVIASAELLREACVEYFDWVEANPLWEIKAFAFQGQVTQEPIPKMRAMTKGGLCLFLGIDMTTWDRWKTGDDQDFCSVIHEAEEIIRCQKFSGAAADLLNANIIARDLGLRDKGEIDHKSSDGSMTPDNLDDAELDKKIEEKLKAIRDASS